MIQTLQTRRSPRYLALALTALLCGPVLLGLTGCGNKGGDTGAANGTTTAPAGNGLPGPNMSNNPTMNGNPTTPPKQGMSTGKKAVIVLAGAALLYYLYKKHQAAQQAQQGGAQGSGATPQLFRSSNGGVYYRDPQNPQKVTWLTVPSQGMSVPANQVQQYAPDYQQYQGQAAAAPPPGQATQSVSQYDPSLAGS